MAPSAAATSNTNSAGQAPPAAVSANTIRLLPPPAGGGQSAVDAGAPASAPASTSTATAAAGGARVVMLLAAQSITAVCNDWSTSSVTVQADACLMHGGILDWLGQSARRAAEAAASSGDLLDHASGISTGLLSSGEPLSIQAPAAPNGNAGGGAGAAPAESATPSSEGSIATSDDDAQPAPGAPPTAVCSDGLLSYNADQSQACAQHGGISQWLAGG